MKASNNMRVSNMTSPRTNNKVANQFVITDNNGYKYFQSYDSVIAKIEDDGESRIIFLDKHLWDYSRTTVKYLAQFLRYEAGEPINTKKDIQEQIKSGDLKLTSLDQQ